MVNKPVVAYIESSSDNHMTGGNYHREALNFFLREDCGCEVLLYEGDYDFEEDLARLKQYAKFNILVLVIVAQAQYSDEHERVINCVRTNLSPRFPINVIPGGFTERFEGRTDDPAVHVNDHMDKGLEELVRSLTANWKAPIDWLGAETKDDQAILMSQLENAYRTHYLGDNDEGMFGTPDVNSQIVSEALRLRLLPSQFLKAEFDDTLPQGRTSFDRIEQSVYAEELAKIRAMTEAERNQLSDALSRARGHEPSPGGGVFVTRASNGPDVAGFAIDPLTLETVVINRFGLHAMAAEMLRYRIGAIEEIRSHDFVDKYGRETYIIEGLIFTKIDGFQTPLLQLFVGEFQGTEPEHQAKVARFLLAEQKYIPINYDMKVIEG
ncbi:MAG: hypothetical protein KW788_04900 [Candidatus Doudnabacteria bacterium]|nr:hypothetical protein [Candidatus Doudnabacteria bacterium]